MMFYEIEVYIRNKMEKSEYNEIWVYKKGKDQDMNKLEDIYKWERRGKK